MADTDTSMRDAGRGEGGQVGGHHHGGDVLGLHDLAAGVDAQPLQHGLDALLGERRVLQAVAGAVEADHQAVADQHVVADALDVDQVLDPGESERRGRPPNAAPTARAAIRMIIRCAAHERLLPFVRLLLLPVSCRLAAGISLDNSMG